MTEIKSKKMELNETKQNARQDPLIGFKCKVNFIAKEYGQVALYNHKQMQGAIYEILANGDPTYTYYHKNIQNAFEKPWSFSLLKFRKRLKKSRDKKGNYKAFKGVRGYFFFKTIDLNAYKAFMKGITEKADTLSISGLPLKVTGIESDEIDFTSIKNDIGEITISLETPTYFYNSSEKEILAFTKENFAKKQIRKMRRIKKINRQMLKYFRDKYNRKMHSLGFEISDEMEILPYFWISNRDLKKSFGYIPAYRKGDVGKVDFKLVGNDKAKKKVMQLLFISSIVGIGNKSSMGFGHSSIKLEID